MAKDHKNRIKLSIFAALAVIFGFLLYLEMTPQAGKSNGLKVTPVVTTAPEMDWTGYTPRHKKALVKTHYGEFDLTEEEPFKIIPKTFRKQSDDKKTKLYFVHLNKRTTKEIKRKISNVEGVKIKSYVPENTLIVEAPVELEEQLEEIEEVEAVVERPPYFSISPNVLEKVKYEDDVKIFASSHPFSGLDRNEFVQSGFPVNDVNKIDLKLVPMSTKGTSPMKLLYRLADRNDVAWVSLDIPKAFMSPGDTGTTTFTATNSGPSFYNLGGNQKIQGGLAEEDYTPIWDAGILGSGQIVTVTDSGLDADHLMFYDSANGIIDYDNNTDALANSGEVDENQRKVIAYFDLTSDPGYPYENADHGTHVAGTVAGYYLPDGPASVVVDVYEFKGPGLGYGLTDFQEFPDDFNGVALASKLIINDIAVSFGALQILSYKEIFDKSVENDSFINTNSWGADLNIYNGQSVLIDESAYENPELLILFSAGNAGGYDDLRYPQFPDGTASVSIQSNSKNIIVVGANGNGGNADEGEEIGANTINDRANFSSQGPAADGRIRPHVMAQGNVVYSAYSDGFVGNGNEPNEDLLIQQGTSMSTPMTAGAAALIRDYLAQGFYPSGSKVESNAWTNPTAALIRSMIIASGQDMVGGVNGDNEDEPIITNIPNNSQGWGRVQLDQVLYLGNEGQPQVYLIESEEGLESGETAIYPLAVSDNSQNIKVVLTWTDYPADPSAAKTIVNDLNLVVTSPDGSVSYFGNDFENGFTKEAVTSGSADGDITDPDNLHIIEVVHIPKSAIDETGGQWTISVEGFDVPEGPQNFAITVTGALPTGGPENAIYVDANATGDNDGTTWANAYTDLSRALGNASSGDQIWVTAGNYVPKEYDAGEDNEPILTTATTSFNIPQGVSLYGGFNGTEFALHQRDLDNNETTLLGQYSGGQVYHVVEIINGINTTISDLTITGGKADSESNDADTKGAGIYMISGSNVTLNNLTLRNNFADTEGGAIYIQSGNNDVTFSKLTISNNSAAFGGGIALSTNSSIRIENSEISLNSATQLGGGLYVDNSGPFLSNLIIDGNSATSSSTSRGGGIAIVGNSTLKAYHVTFVDNRSMGTDGAASHIDYYEAATGTSSCRFLNTIFADASPLNKLVQGGAILNNVYNYSVIQDLDEYGLNEAQKLNNVEANFEDLFKGSEDYSLLETSPARDIGVADASERPLVGIIGTLRDSQPDAGAYEYAFEEVTVEGATPEGGFTTIFDSLAQSPAQNNGTLAPNDRDALDISNESFVMKFRIRNNGSANSKINDDIRVNISGTDASSFVVTRLPSITIPAQSYTEFEITFTPNKVGRSSATVTINTTDSDNTSYTFPIGGEASINGLTVIGNNNVIQNGSNNPKSSNNTDFGVLAAEYSQNTDSQGEPIGLPQFELADPEGKTLAYEIRNYSDEQITNISVRLEEQDGTNGFTLDTTDLPNFLDEGQGTTFYINLKPTDIEDYVANVTVTSNVDNKDPYTFLIIGTTLGDSDGGGNGSNTRSSGAGGGCSIAGDSSPAWYIPFATLALFMFGLRLRSNKE